MRSRKEEIEVEGREEVKNELDERRRREKERAENERRVGRGRVKSTSGRQSPGRLGGDGGLWTSTCGSD